MELASVDNTINFPNTGQTDTAAAVNFVCELLKMTLAGQNSEVIIEPQEFLFDSETGIETTGLLRTEVTSEDVVETDEKTEITLSGTVKNDQEQQEIFLLHFCMRREKSATTSVRNGCKMTPGTNSLLIHFDHGSQQMPDSVFDLDLYQRDLSGYQHSLGKGRGFLVFGSRA